MKNPAPQNPNEMVLNWARSTVLAVPTIYDKNGLWWLWNYNNHQYEETDETELLNILRGGNNLGDSVLVKKPQIITALQLEARNNMPPELPANKIQFRDKVYNINTGDTEPILETDGMPRHFTTNSIPHILGDSEETPILDRLFSEWVGPDNKQILYEVIAYCAYRKYPLHSIIVLNGSGRNGKSTFLRVLENFIGEKNLGSTDFERLANNRFETFSLYRKLGVIMGETNFNVLKSTSLLKRLSGDDLVQFEKKGGATINAHSYATLLVATNSLPISEDETEGFYRRWIIIDFPNEFQEGKDVTFTIPPTEYRNLARKITRILPELLDRCSFTGQGTIAERKQKYISASNPFEDFVNEYCYTENPDATIPYRKLYQKYLEYLRKYKKRAVVRKEFSKILDNKGYEIRKTTLQNDKGEYIPDRYVFGIKLRESPLEFEGKNGFIPHKPHIPLTPLNSIRIGTEWDYGHKRHNGHISPVLPELENGEIKVKEERIDLSGGEK